MSEQIHYDHEKRLSQLEERVDNLIERIDELTKVVDNLNDILTRVDGVRRLVQFMFYISTLIGGAWLSIYTFFHGGTK